MPVNFFTEETSEIKIPKRRIKAWLKQCISLYNKEIKNINYIFCSDEYLHEINKKYLNHDYYTDIITFNYNEDNFISGDLYISLDRVKDNSNTYHIDFYDELQRVIIHGILHLVGFDDKNSKQKQIMRKEENRCLLLYDQNS